MEFAKSKINGAVVKNVEMKAFVNDPKKRKLQTEEQIHSKKNKLDVSVLDLRDSLMPKWRFEISKNEFFF